MGSEIDQHDGFHDYTIATTLEKLIAAIEKALRHILSKELPRYSGELVSGNLLPAPAVIHTRIHHTLPFRTEAYSLSLHLPAHGIHTPADSTPLSTPRREPTAWPLGDQPHTLQEWFLSGLPCLVLAPESYSGRVLEEEEAQTLLSAGAAALSHLHLPWPLCIPVHDALRDAYRGVALHLNGSVVKLESESVHSRSLLDGLNDAPAQLEFFAKRLRTHSPAGAAVLNKELAYLEEEEQEEEQEDVVPATAIGMHQVVECAQKRSYQVPSLMNIGRDDEDSSHRDDDVFELVVDTWDDDAPWRPWAAEDDPLGGLEVDALWRYRLPEHRRQLSAPSDTSNATLTSAHAWRMVAVQRDYVPDTGRRSLIVLQAVDQRRAFLKLQSITTVPAGQLDDILRPSSSAAFSCATSFSSMLRAMLDQSHWVGNARDASELAGDEWWLQQGNYVPPLPTPHVLQDAVRDLFDAPELPSLSLSRSRAGAASVKANDRSSLHSSPSKEKEERGGKSFMNGLETLQSSTANTTGTTSNPMPVGKAAPLSSMTSRLALHVMRLGNPRATAMLWARFVRELRFAHWEPGVALPRMPLLPRSNTKGASNSGGENKNKNKNENGVGEEAVVPIGQLDLSCCILEQKLQLLQMCITARNARHTSGKDAASKEAAPTPQNIPDSIHRPEDEDDTSSMSAYASAIASSTEGMESASDRGITPEPSDNAVSWVETVAAALADQTISNDKAEDAISAIAGSVDRLSPPRGPLGVAGQMDVCLLNDPQRLINIPVTQDAPPCTEDSLVERAAAAQALKSMDEMKCINDSMNGNGGDSSAAAGMTIGSTGGMTIGSTGGMTGDSSPSHPPLSTSPSQPQPQTSLSGVWMQIEGAMLLSDMQAFKAANPGCCLEDFVRWHSPKDLVQGENGQWELSTRMMSPQGPWMGLWERAPAVPAVDQRPLFQPELEGERVLHYLETLSPAEVHAQLLSLGFAAAVGLLEKAPAVKLTAVNAQVERLRQVAHAWLRDGGVAAPSIEDSEHGEESKETNDLMAKGLSMHSMGVLVNALACVEHTITAAQSIIQRLTPPQNGDTSSAASWNSFESLAPLTAKVADGLIATALGGHTSSGTSSGSSSGSSSSCAYGATVDLSLEEIQELQSMIGDSLGEEWVPEPFATEWSVEVFSEKEEQQQQEQPVHRLFVRRLPSELRVATTMTSEV